MKRTSEPVISPIVLKYYKTPKRNDQDMPFFKCAWCFELKNRTGGGFMDKKGKLHQICETCAVWEYRKNNGFKTLTAARARRRRIFDVSYLLNEAVLDNYMKERGIRSFKECTNANDVFIKASELYDLLFSKEDKVRLEETDNQKYIEKEIALRLLRVDFDRFFSGI